VSVFLPWSAAVAGAIAIAALLLALQRLRPAPRTVRLPAAPLWAQAMQHAPARVLDRPLRHWWAYLLALGIALLLWGAFAQPGRDEVEAGGSMTFYLDSSAAMAGDAAPARAQLMADVAATPAARRKVVLGDGSGAVLLRPGEPVGLLARRLEYAGEGGKLDDFAAWLKGASRGSVRYYGHPANFPGEAPDRLAAGFLAASVRDNRGIVTLSAGPAASGAWNRSDVVVRAIDAAGKPLPPDALIFSYDRKAPGADATGRGPDGAIVLSDLAANGAKMTVRLRARDGFAQDDEASITLPLRRTTKVAIGGDAPAVVAQTVARDPALVRSDPDSADVVVNISAAGDTPALRLTRASDHDTIIFAGPGEAAELAGSVDASGIAPWAARAAAGRSAPTVSLDAAGMRGLTLPRALLSGSDDPAAQAAQPILVSRALLWLAGRGDGDARVSAALPGEDTTRAVARSAAESVTARRGALVWPWPVWMLAAALLLLMAEWWLFNRGRMP
jgi:hypothetical protein